MNKKLKKIFTWAAFLAIPAFFSADFIKETAYLNRKFEETTKDAMVDLVKSKYFLDCHEYDSCEVYGLRAMLKFEDWKDIPCEYVINKEILKFLNQNIINNFESYGLGIYYKSIDERAKRNKRNLA